jgi:dTDP-4-amino-4,6-dideoxygalactose transaminase
MGIRYLIGRSGSGKTQQVYQEIGEAVKKGENRLILMVPEQFTLQAERDLIRKQNLPGLLDAEVLSFTRLAHKIFNEVGGLTRTHINEQGRHMILRRLLDKLNDHLTVYKSVSRQSGFIEKTNQLLSDLKKHDITPDQLRRMAEKFQASPLLSGKLMDTALIYEAFQQYLEERYMDSEDAINALVDRIEQYQGLNGARIWLDGFDYFPPQSVRVLEKLALTARELTITFTMDARGKSRDQDVFRVHALSLQKVRRIAKEYKIHEEFVYFPQEGHVNETKENAADLHRVPELAHLERQLYQYPYQEYSEEVIHIEGFAAGNPESEIERLAGRILSLSRTRGWRYREMTVVSGDLSVYGSLIKRVFTQYGIPFFLDEKRPVIQNPIVDLVLSCLRVTGRGYRYEEVFKLLKTGFCGLSRDQTELLENYCLEYGIKGKKWKQPFHLGEKDYPLEVLNDCRKLIMDPEDVEKKISPHTKAIIPVHMLGYPCDMDRIMSIADKYNLLVLEDACQAVGGSYKGRRLGSIGHAGAYSFNYFKIISCGEGGAVLTNERTVFEKAVYYHDGGAAFRRDYVGLAKGDKGSSEYTVFPIYGKFETPVFAGSQARQNEIMGAVMRVQLKRLDGILEDLRKVKMQITDELRNVPKLTFLKSNDENGGCCTHIGFIFEDENKARAFAGSPGVNGALPIDSGRHVYTNWEPIMNKRGAAHPAMNPFNMHANQGLNFNYSSDMCSRTLELLRRTVNIALNPDWTQETIREKVDSIKKAAQNL